MNPNHGINFPVTEYLRNIYVTEYLRNQLLFYGIFTESTSLLRNIYGILCYGIIYGINFSLTEYLRNIPRVIFKPDRYTCSKYN